MFEPSLRAHTLWERHGIDLKLDTQSTVYNQNSSLNQNNASLKGNAWIDIAHDLAVLTNFQVAHLNEGVGTLSSPANAVTPTPYNLLSGDVTLRKQFNRLTTSVGFRTDSYDFGSARAQDGTVINQDGRDGQIYSLHSRIDYAFSSTLGWFAGVEGNQRDIRGIPGHTLDSQGYRALSGITVGLANLITGEFGAGYVQQRFDDPDHRHHRRSVLSRPADLAADPPARRPFQGRAARHADLGHQSPPACWPTPCSSGSITNCGATSSCRSPAAMRPTASSDRQRKDRVTTSDARVKYLLNRFSSISAYYRYTARNSDIAVFSFDKHLVGMNVTAQF